MPQRNGQSYVTQNLQNVYIYIFYGIYVEEHFPLRYYVNFNSKLFSLGIVRTHLSNIKLFILWDKTQ